MPNQTVCKQAIKQNETRDKCAESGLNFKRKVLRGTMLPLQGPLSTQFTVMLRRIGTHLERKVPKGQEIRFQQNLKDIRLGRNFNKSKSATFYRLIL